MKKISRREFIKYGLGGMTAIAIGSVKVPEFYQHTVALASNVDLNLTITDAHVEMINLQQVYMWVFADPTGPKFPGPAIFAREGDRIRLNITNSLDEPHAVAVSGTRINSGPIPPSGVRELEFDAPRAGSYIYYDPLNPPVNRVLGLHGALVVLPDNGNTPYSNPTPTVQQLFNDLGTTSHFPGNPWIPERSYIWLWHTTDPRFNAMAEPAGAPPINRVQFMREFKPLYFTIGGKSGSFSAEDPTISPRGRVGQPALIRLLNTGLATHSAHIHGNHVYVTSRNGTVQNNIEYIETFSLYPMDRIDWLVPFIRPPDIPDVSERRGIPNPNRLIRLDAPQELASLDRYGIPQKPFDYPMHDHMEPSQTSNGGNYNTGMLTHIIFTGDVDGVEW